MNEEHPSSKDNVDMDAIVGQANQLANTILLALRTVHEYIVPRALSHGIKLSARDQHAWAMNLTIALSQAKAHRWMPATRLQKPTARRRAPVESDDSQTPRKSELFPRAEPPAGDPVPFSNPAISPALAKLRQMLSNDHVEEEELLAILRESSPRQTLFLSRLDEISARTAELCLQRWPVIVELVESMRADNGEAA
jgi:hypothetical protein